MSPSSRGSHSITPVIDDVRLRNVFLATTFLNDYRPRPSPETSDRARCSKLAALLLLSRAPAFHAAAPAAAVILLITARGDDATWICMSNSELATYMRLQSGYEHSIANHVDPLVDKEIAYLHMSPIDG